MSQKKPLIEYHYVPTFLIKAEKSLQYASEIAESLSKIKEQN